MTENSSSSRKEHILQELKELAIIFLYLAASFSILETMRSLILIQLGINNFIHGFVVALVEALALSKIVLLAQRLPLLNALNNRSLALSAFYQAVIMALVVFFAGQLEEKLFAHHVADAPVRQQLGVTITHLATLLFVFYVPLVIRGLDRVLGPGKLAAAFLTPGAANAEAAESRPAS
jgi:hypothetical protein